MPRKYVLKRRAEQRAATRRRIVEATIALHQLVGPAATTLSAVAERAGVQRHTLYSHFPEPRSLFQACREHYLALNPLPNPVAWRTLADPKARFRTGLGELYRYYEANAEMIGSTLRDSDRTPSGTGFIKLHEAAAGALLGGMPSVSIRLRAASWLATDFYAWRSLVQAGLDVDQAVAAMVDMLECQLASSR